ncbi:MAG: N-acetylmuramic acid 6-phosphate etherase [Planctomycetes bacterium]|nr:N-acetylmuramic acid 6-phosphate etherase [Planctomycetota bacterium]
MGSPRREKRPAARFQPDPAELTEAVNPASIGIDALPTPKILGVIHREDRRAWLAVGRALERLAPLIDRVVESFRRGGRLIYVGAGSSGRLGVLDASECPPTFSVPPGRVVGLIAGGDRALRNSIEGAEDSGGRGARAIRRRRAGPRDVICGIAASGSTPYVLGALAAGKARGAATALITSNRLEPGRKKTLPVDFLIELLAGPEVIAGSTRLKAGTATKMALNMITTAAMIRWGKVYDNLMVDVRPVNRKLIRRATALIAKLGSLETAAAARLLERSGRSVKAAIVMARLGAGRAAAERRLRQAGGSLRQVLERFKPRRKRRARRNKYK